MIDCRPGNDTIDIMHALVPSAYANFVVLDGRWASSVNQASGRLRRAGHRAAALVEYLKNGRPATDLDAFFLCSVPPVRAFSSHVNVSYIVAAAIHRAGVQRPSRGAAHLLRHSAATALLRQGASLQDIGTLLRHRSLRSSEIYAKVDVNALQQIVQPWLQMPSC